jgi:hypothetical protein
MLRKDYSPIQNIIISINYKSVDDTYNILYELVQNYEEADEITDDNYIELSQCVLEFIVDDKYSKNFYKNIQFEEFESPNKYYSTFKTFYHNCEPINANIKEYLAKFYCKDFFPDGFTTLHYNSENETNLIPDRSILGMFSLIDNSDSDELNDRVELDFYVPDRDNSDNSYDYKYEKYVS